MAKTCEQNIDGRTGNKFQIGFMLNHNLVPYIEICYDLKNHIPLYTKHKVYAGGM
jgi:hypothetical protein